MPQDRGNQSSDNRQSSGSSGRASDRDSESMVNRESPDRSSFSSRSDRSAQRENQQLRDNQQIADDNQQSGTVDTEEVRNRGFQLKVGMTIPLFGR